MARHLADSFISFLLLARIYLIPILIQITIHPLSTDGAIVIWVLLYNLEGKPPPPFTMHFYWASILSRPTVRILRRNVGQWTFGQISFLQWNKTICQKPHSKISRHSPTATKDLSTIHHETGLLSSGRHDLGSLTLVQGQGHPQYILWLTSPPTGLEFTKKFCFSFGKDYLLRKSWPKIY